MRARIVPRFENAARDLFSSKPTRGYVYIYIYIFKACLFRRNEAHRTNFSLPASFRLASSLSPPLPSFIQRHSGELLSSVRPRIVSRIHGIIKSHDSKALLAHGLCLVYLARCHGQIIQSRCTWRLLMLVKPASHGYRSIRTRE